MNDYSSVQLRVAETYCEFLLMSTRSSGINAWEYYRLETMGYTKSYADAGGVGEVECADV